MTQGKALSKEAIATIREQVLTGKSKSQVARDFNIIYSMIWYHTRDIRIQIVKAKELIDKIREEVKNGKSKFQVAQDHNLSRTIVYGCTKL